jgi:hypothetical protein
MNTEEEDLQIFDTGAMRANVNKLRLDLLPFKAIEDIAEVITFGTKKYDENNWRKGFPWTSLIASALRHIFAWIQGEDTDPESGLSHIAHAGCNLLFLLETIRTERGEDDRYRYE